MSPTSLCGRKIRCKYRLIILFTQVLSPILNFVDLFSDLSILLMAVNCFVEVILRFDGNHLNLFS